MPFGKTQEQKETEARDKALRDEAARAERERDAFLASPIGQATTAKEQGQGFFEIQLKVGSSQRDSTVWGGNNFALSKVKTQSHAGTLAGIEGVGWRLEHVGYVFMVTGESSRDKFMSSGQQTAVSGELVGIYLFRNADPAV
ncbi:hypothetical protein GCM10022399_12040 [Terrabacter ginsenosidimutans]|uniref:Uncharacterized protein n=1 Tax=Terrabacter ginsenosidimutans TaxID=490575 RepID=A0ABP7CY46_9MICO